MIKPEANKRVDQADEDNVGPIGAKILKPFHQDVFEIGGPDPAARGQRDIPAPPIE
jgi:hypothetical protein